MVWVLERMNEPAQDIKSSNSPIGHEPGPLSAGVSKHPDVLLLKDTWHGVTLISRVRCRGYQRARPASGII